MELKSGDIVFIDGAHPFYDGRIGIIKKVVFKNSYAVKINNIFHEVVFMKDELIKIGAANI